VRVAFYYECGEIREVGTGHRYRSREIGSVLEQNNHIVEYIENDNRLPNVDILVVDHINSCHDIITNAKACGIKVVLIDGHQDDVSLVDVSVSAVVNTKAQYYGIDYLVFPTTELQDRYEYKGNNTVFVGMGGFDANNIVELVLPILNDMGYSTIVAKSINHDNIIDKFNNVEVFKDKDFFNAMRRCDMAITNGGLTFFQSLYYGLPTIGIPQYEHQKDNIDSVGECCITAKQSANDIAEKITLMGNDKKYMQSLSSLSSNLIDGNGVNRICDIIGGLGDG